MDHVERLTLWSNITLRRLQARAHHGSWVVLIALAAIVLVWLPFRFNMLGVIEEWGLSALFVEKGVFFITGAGSPLPHLQLRPLNVAPLALAHVLTPDSFFAWNVINSAAIAAKSIGMYCIVWWIVRDRWLALASGLLFMLYPADTMQMTLRSIHINCAVAASVGGIALLLAARDEERAHMRVIRSVSGMAMFVVGGLTYEAGLFLAPAYAVAVWVRFGLTHAVRTVVRPTSPNLAWLAAIAIQITYFVVVSRRSGLYQQDVIGHGGNTIAVLLERLPLLFTVGLYREFADAWFDAARIVMRTPALWAWFAVTMALIGLLFVVTRRTAGNQRQPETAVLLRLLVAGIVIAALGYLPYLSSMSHILITQRTHLYAAVGGALGVTALLALAFGRIAVLSAAAWCVAIGLAFAAQWNQVDHYLQLSDRMRMILSGILENAPDLPADGRLMIIDHSGQLHSTWMLRGDLLGSALTYLLGRRVHPVVCVEPGLLWASFVTDAQARPGRCVEHAAEWEIGVGVPGTFKVPKEGLVFLEISPEGLVRRRTNEPVPAPGPLTAQRWRSILGCWPAKACRYSPPRDVRWQFDFGTWWSLEDAPWGAGWRDAEWNPPAWEPLSYAWMIGETSRLWAPLDPRPGQYLFQMRVYNWISAEAKDKLRVSINGHEVPVRWENERHVFGYFDGQILRQGLNDVTLSSKSHPVHGISLAVDWVRLEPQ